VSLVAKRFPIHFGRFNSILMGALGMGRRRSYVDVTDDDLTVRMGWAFRATIPRSSIVEVGRRGYVWWAYGVHMWRSRWIVNGSGHDVVTMRIDPPARAGIPWGAWKVREVWLSLDDPDGFRAAIGR
jgi:hypothetical protein